MPSNYSRTSKEPFHNSVAWLQPIYEFIFDVTCFECTHTKNGRSCERNNKRVNRLNLS